MQTKFMRKEADSGEIVYGVLFSRSIGDQDAHENLGISAEPEIFDFEMPPEMHRIMSLSPLMVFGIKYPAPKCETSSGKKSAP